MEYEQNQECEYLEDCRNADNSIKCSKCEHNPFNFEMIDKYGSGPVHDRKSKAFYGYADNYDPK